MKLSNNSDYSLRFYTKEISPITFYLQQRQRTITLRPNEDCNVNDHCKKKISRNKK